MVGSLFARWRSSASGSEMNKSEWNLLKDLSGSSSSRRRWNCPQMKKLMKQKCSFSYWIDSILVDRRFVARSVVRSRKKWLWSFYFNTCTLLPSHGMLFCHLLLYSKAFNVPGHSEGGGGSREVEDVVLIKLASLLVGRYFLLEMDILKNRQRRSICDPRPLLLYVFFFTCKFNFTFIGPSSQGGEGSVGGDSGGGGEFITHIHIIISAYLV